MSYAKNLASLITDNSSINKNATKWENKTINCDHSYKNLWLSMNKWQDSCKEKEFSKLSSIKNSSKKLGVSPISSRDNIKVKIPKKCKKYQRCIRKLPPNCNKK